MENFSHLFDILNNDDPNIENNIIKEYSEDFDFDLIDRNVDEEEMILIDEDDDDITTTTDADKIVEEQILSRKLSQLSTEDDDDNYYDDVDIDDDHNHHSSNNNNSKANCDRKRHLSTPSTPDIIPSKKTRQQFDYDDDQNDFLYQTNRIPRYLQECANEFFQTIFTSHVSNRTTAAVSFTAEDLRRFALLKHQMTDLHFHQQLWEIYLKSGTGQWETEESKRANVDRRLWPNCIKKLMPPKVITTMIDNNEHQICEVIVHQHLKQFNSTVVRLKNEYEQKKHSLTAAGLTSETIDKIERFVQQYGIQQLEMSFNHKRTLLECNYDAEILEREFQRLQPTEYQIRHAQRLYDSRFKYVESIQKLIELKHRILCNKPNKSMYSVVESSLSMLTDGDDNNSSSISNILQCQEKLTDSMIAAIIGAEDNIHEYRQLFEEDSLQLYIIYDDQNEHDDKLTKNIYRRLKVIDKKVQSTYRFQINSLVRNHYSGGNDDDDSLQQTDRLSFGFLPSLIIDTSVRQLQLTVEQLKLLNRGPTYVSPCQMYTPSSFVSMRDMLEKQYILLKHNLTILFGKMNLNLVQSTYVQKEIKETFMNIFSTPLPLRIYQRALYEKQLIQSIRQYLKKNHLILRRTANQQNLFYLGSKKDFQDKANEFMNTNANGLLFEVNYDLIDPANLQPVHAYLTQIIYSMNSEFDSIFNNKTKYRDILKKLHIADISQTQLPYLYFLPDVSTAAAKKSNGNNSLSLKPVIAGVQRSITCRLGRFLSKLFQPIMEIYMRPTTFINGADFMRKLNGYAEDKHFLHPTTMFATIKIPKFNTLVPHGTMLITLKDFLDQNLAMSNVENISAHRIIHLTALFLHNNRFYYDNKIYRFMKGAPNCLPFTKTLSNIYIYQWQRSFFAELSRHNEFYGRCQDQIFLTWNRTTDEFHELLHQTVFADQDSSFEIDVNIGFKTQFLNAFVQNLEGTLYSCVYHDPAVLKYTLPYVIGDATVAHSHWLRSALIRAVRYCTSVFDFNHERIYLELTYLTNGYPLEFIEQRLQHFFTYFGALSLRSTLDQNVYDRLRLRLFNFISEQHHISSENRELNKNNQQVQLTYVYQFGPKHQFEKKLQEILYKNLSASSSAAAAVPTPTAAAIKAGSKTATTTTTTTATNKPIRKITLQTKQQYSLNSILSQQKPNHPLLNEKKIRF